MAETESEIVNALQAELQKELHRMRSTAEAKPAPRFDSETVMRSVARELDNDKAETRDAIAHLASQFLSLRRDIDELKRQARR